MSWKDIPDSGGQSENIPAGHYTLRFVKVLRGPKDKEPFTSSNGDPQIMLVAADDQDREAAVMVTLSEKAAWKLKSYLVAVGADLDAMDRDGVDFRNFADADFAAAQLIDRPFRGEVSWEKSKKPGETKQYADIKPLRAPTVNKTAVDEIPL